MNPSLLQKQPWLIEPESFAAIFEILRASFPGQPFSDPAPESPALEIDSGVALIAIRGPMLRNPDGFDRVVIGACDTEEIARAVQEAASRADVQAIFLDIDSPGGSVNGTPELARAVADAAKEKYVYAFTAGQMCSAAYWVASQADAVYAAPSARVGSIGVLLPLIDSSEAFKNAGLKMEVFAAGKFKSTGVPGTSLTDEQRQWLQGEVEETFADFRAAVLVRGRKIPDEAMQGQTFSARRAQRLNLAGMVAGRAEALARLRQLHVRPVDTAHRTMSAPSIENELADAREQLARLQSETKAHEATIAAAQADGQRLQERIDALESEKQIESEALIQARADLDAARASIAQIETEKTDLLGQLQEIRSRNENLEAAEKDIERRAALRAAQIVAETGTQAPANISPKGDGAQADDLLEQFRAISDPTEQTAFWQKLSPAQQAQILARSTSQQP